MEGDSTTKKYNHGKQGSQRIVSLKICQYVISESRTVDTLRLDLRPALLFHFRASGNEDSAG